MRYKMDCNPNVALFLGIWVAALTISHAATISASKSTLDTTPGSTLLPIDTAVTSDHSTESEKNANEATPELTTGTSTTTTIGPQSLSTPTKTIIIICVSVFVGIPVFILTVCILKSVCKCGDDQKNKVGPDEEKLEKFRWGHKRKEPARSDANPAAVEKDGDLQDVEENDEVNPDAGYGSQNYENQGYYDNQNYEGYDNGAYEGQEQNGEYNYDYDYEYDKENPQQYDYTGENVENDVSVEDCEGNFEEDTQQPQRPTSNNANPEQENAMDGGRAAVMVEDMEDINRQDGEPMVEGNEVVETKVKEKKKKKKKEKKEKMIENDQENLTPEDISNVEQVEGTEKEVKKKKKRTKVEKKGEIEEEGAAVAEENENPEKKKKKKKKDSDVTKETEEIEEAEETGVADVEPNKKKKKKKKKKEADEELVEENLD